jgi:hypothetical protein
MGGGETGANFVDATCTGGTGCNGKGGYIGDGPGTKYRTGNLVCGGTCTTIAKGFRDAKE